MTEKSALIVVIFAILVPNSALSWNYSGKWPWKCMKGSNWHFVDGENLGIKP